MEVVNTKQELIVSSNDLVHAKYDMSLWEKRVFTYAIMHIGKEDTEFKVMRFKIYDILKFFQVGHGAKVYEILREVPKKLDKVIEVPYFSEKGQLRYGYVRLLKSYTLPGSKDEDNQYIELCFNDDLKKDLLELRDKFTRYDSKNIIGLQSVYSFRFFEMLKSYEFRHEVELEISYLRDFLKLGEKYEAFKDFRTNIIDKAQRDLAENCDIVFEYEAKKRGNKFASILFKIQKNPKFKQETKGAKSTATPLSINPETAAFDDHFFTLLDKVVNEFGVSSKVFKTLYDNFSVTQIENAIQVTAAAAKNKTLENPAGYFIEAVRQGFTHPKVEKAQAEQAQREKIKRATDDEKSAQDLKNELKRAAYLRERNQVLHIVENEPDFAQNIVEQMRYGLFGQYFDPQKSIIDNMENKLFEGAFINEMKKRRTL